MYLLHLLKMGYLYKEFFMKFIFRLIFIHLNLNYFLRFYLKFFIKFTSQFFVLNSSYNLHFELSITAIPQGYWFYLLVFRLIVIIIRKVFKSFNCYHFAILCQLLFLNYQYSNSLLKRFIFHMIRKLIILRYKL